MRAALSVRPRRSSGSVAWSNSSTGAWRLGRRTRGMIGIVHVTDEILAPLRERYGKPAELEWTGDDHDTRVRARDVQPGAHCTT